MPIQVCRPAPRVRLLAPRVRLLAPLAWLLAPVALAGCYDSSGRDTGGADAGTASADGGGGPSDYACDCCGTTVLARSPADCPAACAPHCRDAGIDPSCGPRTLDLACFDHVRAGTPTSIEIVAGMAEGCFCDQALSCTARVAGDRTLAIDTVLCPEIPVCRACQPFARGTCEIPALREGSWEVIVNGERALDLEVTPADVVPERGATCIRRAIVDSCGAIWDPRGFDVGRACLPTDIPEGQRPVIRVHDACGGCQQRGPCQVDVFGDVIRVSATRMPNSCEIACPPACFDDEHVCIGPPLAAGEYRVVVDGLADEGRIRVGATAGDEACFGAIP